MVVIRKVITCNIYISLPEDIISPNYQQMRLEKLKNTYLNKCYSGMLITDIVEILHTSAIVINPKTMEGEAGTSIRFIAEGVVLEPGDIIADAKINNITNTIALATSKHATININLSNTISILKNGDITPVIVTMSKYNISSPLISIAARPFLPSIVKNICIYKCEGAAQDLVNILELRKMYMKYIDELGSDKKKSLNFFKGLLEPSIQEKWEKLVPGSKAQDLSTPLKDGDVVYFPIIQWPILVDKVFITKTWSQDPTPIDKDKYNFVHMTSKTTDVYGEMLMRHIKSLNTLKELVETYPDVASINKSSHIWNYFKKLKSTLK